MPLTRRMRIADAVGVERLRLSRNSIHGAYAAQDTRLYAQTNMGPAGAARFASRFHVAWVREAVTTRSKGKGAKRDLHSAQGVS